MVCVVCFFSMYILIVFLGFVHPLNIAQRSEAFAGRCSFDNFHFHIEPAGVPRLERPETDKIKPCDGDTFTEDREYIKEINKLHTYLDMVNMMVRPGCSPERLKLALSSMSTLFNTLTFVSSSTRPRASL